MSTSVDQLMEQALRAYSMGCIQKAERYYRAVLKQQPANSGASHSLGVILNSLQKNEEGLAYLKSAIETSPVNGQYWVSYIKGLIEASKLDIAVEVLEQAKSMGLQADNLDALEKKLKLEILKTDSLPAGSIQIQNAQISYEKGEFEKTEKTLIELLQLDVSNVLAWSLLSQVYLSWEKVTNAIEALERANNIDPNHPSVLRNKARVLLKQGKALDALKFAQLAYQCEELNVEGWLVLASCLAANNQNTDAHTLVTRALKIRPTYAEALICRGLLKVRSNDVNAGKEDIEAALKIKPHLVRVWALLSSLNYKSKNIKEAIVTQQIALSLDPTNVNYAVDLGEMLRQDGQTERAILVLQGTFKLSPENASVYLNLGVAYQDANMLSSALECYEKALVLKPDFLEALSNIGALAKHRGELELALSYFDRAISLSPSNLTLLINKIKTLIQLKKFKLAETLIQDTLKIHSTHLPCFVCLGSIYISQKRFFDAVATLQKAKELARNQKNLNKKEWLQILRMLASALDNLKRHDEAYIELHLAVEVEPEDAETLHALGVHFTNVLKWHEAESVLRKALSINPNETSVLRLLGGVLDELNSPADALVFLEKAYDINPEDAETLRELGRHSAKKQNWDEAIGWFQLSVEIKPDKPVVLMMLARALDEKERYEEAKDIYLEALKKFPEDINTMQAISNHYSKRKKWDEAELWINKTLRLEPYNANAICNLGNIYYGRGDFVNAEKKLKQALTIDDKLAEAFNSLGMTLLTIGKKYEAEECYRRAIALKPEMAETYINLGSLLKESDRYYESYELLVCALNKNPKIPQAHSNIGSLLQAMGKQKEAVASHQRAIELNPNEPSYYSNLLFCLSHMEEIDPQELFERHREFGEKFEAPLKSSWPVHSNDRDPNRCIKVGFVSGDFRNHAMAYFLVPIFEILSLDRQFCLYAYHNFPSQDSTTERLQSYFFNWSAVHNLTDEALAKKIGDDQIDILIDLSGHTAYNRLAVFARKPAPIQISWMGYPGTTGLEAMDYYVSDNNFLPKGKFDHHFTEEIIRLPVGAIFLPHINSPSINSLPAISNGYLTFGSFNRTNKITRSVIALWSELLRALPDSKMILGAMPAAGEEQNLIKWFEQEEIDLSRLSFFSKLPTMEYLNLHHQIDICLDTFPYNGGTTTWHALWMGVPTLTLAGGTSFYRSGACILGALELTDFVSNDKKEFVQKGLEWSRNLNELAQLRNTMRERFEKSMPGKPKEVTLGFSQAMRTAWQMWTQSTN